MPSMNHVGVKRRACMLPIFSICRWWISSCLAKCECHPRGPMTIPKVPTWYAALFVKPKLFVHSADEQKMYLGTRFSLPIRDSTKLTDSSRRSRACSSFDKSSMQMFASVHWTPASCGARTRIGLKAAQVTNGRADRVARTKAESEKRRVCPSNT